MVHLYVSGESTSQRLLVPSPVTAPVTTMFPWTASSEESEGRRLTREILADPRALEEINAAREEVARGEVVRGSAAVRALRPRR